MKKGLYHINRPGRAARLFIFEVLFGSLIFYGLFFGPSLLTAKTITVGIYQAEPIVFMDNDGQPKGIFVDILSSIAKKEEWDILYKHGTWATCLDRLENGEIDIMTGIAYSDQRANQYDFNRETVITNWGQVYLSKRSPIENFLDLDGRPVAVLKDDIYYNFFEIIGERFGVKPDYREVDSYAAILKLVDSKTVDAGIVTRLYGRYHENSYDIRKSFINFRPTSLRFASIKGNFPEILNEIDKHLLVLKGNKNSSYYRSIDLWVEGVRKITFPDWLRPVWIIAGVGAIIIIILTGNIILRREVRIRTEALKQTIGAKERIESELRIAHDLQMDLVPSHFPAFPERSEIDIYAQLEPAREVGGDFYDFFFIDEDHFCFGIGDVSGKGVPAALFMSMAKTMIKSMGKVMHKPHMILEEVNKEISPDNDSCTFVTVFLGILNTRTGELCYTNAGHNPPILIKNKEHAQFIAGGESSAIGIDEEIEYKGATTFLNPDDILCLYTDGVTEAFNQDGDMYSDERLLQKVRDSRTGTVRVLVEDICQSVHSFSEGAVQSDDITVLAVQYFLSNRSEDRIQKVIILTNQISEISRLKSFVADIGKENHFSEEIVFDITLALEEVFTNIIHYGFSDDNPHEIVIQVKMEKDLLMIQVEDDGKPFNSLEASDPDLSKPLEEREKGGLGIYLHRELMDNLEYERDSGKNILLMGKKVT